MLEELAMAMNINSKTQENLPTLNLDKFKLNHCFKKNKGKEKRIKE
jgi:hypothetical protein